MLNYGYLMNFTQIIDSKLAGLGSRLQLIYKKLVWHSSKSCSHETHSHNKRLIISMISSQQM